MRFKLSKHQLSSGQAPHLQSKTQNLKRSQAIKTLPPATFNDSKYADSFFS
ncbi:hypothetical protein [Pseudomonas sp. 24 R 17]|nr:hypothetical protein [Pseudomonas sp. 24 R 17]